MYSAPGARSSTTAVSPVTLLIRELQLSLPSLHSIMYIVMEEWPSQMGGVQARLTDVDVNILTLGFDGGPGAPDHGWWCHQSCTGHMDTWLWSHYIFLKMIINVQEGRKVDKHTMIGCQNIVEFVAYKCLAFKSREGGRRRRRRCEVPKRSHDWCQKATLALIHVAELILATVHVTY